MRIWVAVVLAAAFGWGVLHYLGIEFEAGDVYPELSSLRADPRGARLLFDSLSRLPGLTVTRNFLPPELFESQSASVLFLGLDAREFGKDMDELRRLRKLAEDGNRVVLAMATLRRKSPIDVSKLNREWDVRLASDSRGVYFDKADGWTVLTMRAERRSRSSGCSGAGRL